MAERIDLMALRRSAEIAKRDPMRELARQEGIAVAMCDPDDLLSLVGAVEAVQALMGIDKHDPKYAGYFYSLETALIPFKGAPRG